MASKLKIRVNGLVHNVTASLDTPLLYVLHNELHLHGPRFGCGLAQCGACSVLLDGKEIRSCVTPVAAVTGKRITTLEGMPALAVGRSTTAGARTRRDARRRRDGPAQHDARAHARPRRRPQHDGGGAEGAASAAAGVDRRAGAAL